MWKRTVSFLACALALAVICATMVRFSSPPELMRRAIPVAVIPDRYLLRSYHWVGPTELLASLDDLNKTGDETGDKVARLRIDTGRLTFLHQNNKATKNAFERTFSPDGQWYLWLTSTNSSFTYDLCATDDTGCRRVYSEHSDGVPSYPYAWIGDSRRWLNTSPLLSNAEVRTLAVPGATSVPLPQPLEACSLILSSDPKHTVLQNSFGEEEVNTVAVAFWDIASPASSRKIQVRLPVRARVMQASVSPSGDRIAWLIDVQEGARFYDMFSHYLHFLPRPKAKHTYQVWTTALDSSSPRLLGVKEVRVVWGAATGCFPAGWQHEGGIYDLGWTADSKRVSFRREETLYTVSD